MDQLQIVLSRLPQVTHRMREGRGHPDFAVSTQDHTDVRMENHRQADEEDLTPRGPSENAESHLPFWKAGSGHYSDTLGAVNQQTVSASIDLVLTHLDQLEVKEQGVFTIADYGANDGSSSMPLMSRVIDHLRAKHGEDLTIQIIYEDQEKNDFNSLFARLADRNSYLANSRNVYPFATNIDFYKQCVPDSSCDVIFTSFALHWLDTSCPSDINFQDHVFDVFATPEERTKVIQQAERDWVKFLTLRAKELKPGGFLIVLNICDDPVHVPSTDLVTDLFLDLETAWKELREEGIISKEEHDKCTCRHRFRNAGEYHRVFNENLDVRRSGLRLVYYDEKENPCTFKAQYKQRCNSMPEAANKAQFAESLIAAHRVWSQTTFYSSLSDLRTEAERNSIMDKLYEKAREAVKTKNPDTYRSDEYLSRVIVRKGSREECTGTSRLPPMDQ